MRRGRSPRARCRAGPHPASAEHPPLGVPLLREGQPIGAITVYRTEVRPFGARQVAPLQTFADQAVIAIENARLFTALRARNTELTEALARQTATGEILGIISRSPTDIQPVLDTMVESAARLCEASNVSIFRRDGDRLRLVAHHGPIPAVPTMPRVRGRVASRSVLDARTVHIADVQAEAAEFPRSSESARHEGWRAILIVPLMREGVAAASGGGGRPVPRGPARTRWGWRRGGWLDAGACGVHGADRAGPPAGPFAA